MQAYSSSFARIYNQHWTSFARQIAPLIHAYYESTPVGQENRRLVDVCCGTGQLALHFLNAGYHVTGIDLSPGMLHYAQENTREYVEAGQAEFYLADAAAFAVEQPAGLVVSTFDALNHLPDLQALRGCFASSFEALVEGGVFIFDLNTPLGLQKRWNSISVEDHEELTLINRSIYMDDLGRAYTKITGFSRVAEGLYERFEETAYNTVFDMAEVRQALFDAGFREAYFARAASLSTPLDDPQDENRIFFVAMK